MLWGLPSALLLLLGAVPLIVFLHSLRPRGIQLRTTTYFIWERVLKKRPLGTRLGWLVRHNLLLILQILAAVFLVGALADPALLHFGAAPGDVVVVLDLSASMKANGRSERRFEGARREFFSLIDHLATGQRMAVIGAGPQPRVLAPFTADKRKLRDLGRALAPLDAPGKVKEAVRLAHGFLKKGSPDRIVVVSDGAFDGAGDFPWGNRYLKLILIEGRNENVALVGFEARRRPGGSETLEIMAHMRNFTGKPVRAPLSLLLNGSVLARREFEIAANGREVAIFTYDGSAEGLLQARLEVEDDFPTDNRAFLALAGAAPLRVAYVGPGNLFLERLLRFLPRAQLTRVERWEDDLTGHDVVIFDRVRPPPLESGNFILINTVAPNLPIRATGKLERPRVELPLERHPITTGVQLADLFVQEALRLAQGEGVTLARSRGGPLLWAYEKGPLRALVISFDILASDLPVRVAFPLLFHNAIEWMRPGQPEFPGLAARAGEPFALPVQDGEIQVTAPSGKKEVVPAAAQPPSFAETFETGVYEYKGAGRAGRFAVNLFDEAESQIASRVGVTGEGRTEAQAPATDARSGLPLWPYLLGTVLALLAAEALLAFRAGAAWPALAARAAACAVVAGALANPRLLQAARQLDVILAVDFSYSVGREGLEKARQLLQAAARTKNPEARTGVLFFAREPVWEFPPRADLPELADLPAREGREETDIEAALQAALADFGEGRQKKIVLISDANENRGESARSLSLLRAQGVEISAVPITLARGKNEIYVADLSMPQRVDSAQSFEIRVAIESLTAARARLKLLRDGVPEQERELELDPGRNAVSFRQALREQGVHRFEVLLESAEDMLAENNLLQGVVQVTGPPRVLYLSGASQRFFARALQTQGYTVVQASPETHAPALSEIASFDLVVLDNVAAYQLSQAAMDAIEKYVRDLGGGLVVVGGTESYGAGGYYRTPLERLLPLDMRPPARLDLPHVALLFVIDKSGSMGAGGEGSSKLDLAKAAALAAADIMNPTDQIGILGFDAAWEWVLPFQPVGKGEWIAERLASLHSDGGTDLYKALVEAHRAMASTQAAIKHVLVLSDGLTDKMDFHSLVTKMTAGGITVSTVAVGADADFKLMAEIAKDGKGRGYVTLDPQTIPQIFTTETLLISRDLLVEKTVTPSIVSPVGALKGFAGARLPAVRGYVLTYPKAHAEVLMKAGDDPLLASWRYGLGRVSAFTSDLSGRWGRDWVTWDAFPVWASQLARATIRQPPASGLQVEFQPAGDRVEVVADLVSADGGFVNHLDLRANLSADNVTEETTLRQIAPGRYQGELLRVRRGINLVTFFADQSSGEGNVAIATVPYVAPYPKEYRALKPNTALLHRLTEGTGGEMLDPNLSDSAIQRLYSASAEKGSRAQETWWALSGAALVLFLSDLIVRALFRRNVSSL